MIFDFSIFSYGNALAFKSIDDEDLDSVQERVRTVLYEMLKENEDGSDKLANKREHSIFFGIYWKNPQQFEFGRGDRKFIRELALHVKGKVDTPSENEGIGHFHRTEKGNAWIKKLLSTANGLFFGSIRTRQNLGSNKLLTNKVVLANNNQISDQGNDVGIALNIEASEANLLSQVEEINKLYVDKGLKPKQDSIVHITSDGTIVRGMVVCCFCEKNVKGSIVKIFYQKTMKSGCWVKSNYIKHLTNVHGRPKVKQFKEKLQTLSTAAHNDSVGVIDDNCSKNTSQAVVQQIASNHSSDTAELDALYKQHVDILFGQMSKQVISMTNTVLSNSEKIFDFHVEMDICKNATTKYIRIGPVSPDGSCLFSAIAHQLFYVKLNSQEHKDWANKLRKQAVDYIKANYERFRSYLRNRVRETNQAESDENKLEAECQKFLSELLPKNSFYGGVESIKAISEIYCVNILTINEDGSSHFTIAFETSNDKTIFVSFRNQNHYDSVVDMDSSTTSRYSKSLAQKEYNRRNSETISLI